MDRMAFIPGSEAKDEIFRAAGHIFFERSTAIAYAAEFLLRAPIPVTGIPHQTMMACMSKGDKVDIWFGLHDPDPSQGHEIYPSGEPVGHTRAILKTVDGNEKTLWEVERATPSMGDAHSVRAFNAYREAFARFKGLSVPNPIRADADQVHLPREYNGKPIISHALSPANLYYASSRMWYFVDLGPIGVATPPHLSRPMRAFDALVLSALMTIVNGSPPLVFGLANTMETLGKLPTKYKRATYEADETLERPSDTPLVVM